MPVCAFDAEHRAPVNIDICMKKTVVIMGDSVQNRYWWPDGVHPNRLAHQRITAELILPYLDNRYCQS